MFEEEAWANDSMSQALFIWFCGFFSENSDIDRLNAPRTLSTDPFLVSGLKYSYYVTSSLVDTYEKHRYVRNDTLFSKLCV